MISRATAPTASSGRSRRPKPALAFAVLGTATMSFTLFRAGEILVSDILFLLAAAVIVAKILTGNDRDLAPSQGRWGPTTIAAGAILLLTAGTLSSIRSWDPTGSMLVVLRFGWVTLIWFWIMRTVCRDRDDFNLILRAWKVSSIVTAFAAVLGQLGIAYVTQHSGDRQVGLAGHPNQLAGHLAATFLLFLLAVPEQHAGRTGRARLWWLLSVGLCATALFASGSMTGLFGIVAGLGVMGVAYITTRTPRAATARRSPLGPVLVVLLVVVGAVRLFTSDLAVVDRITRYREGDTYVTNSVDSRGQVNSLVTNRFDDFLIVGLGFNNATANVAASQSLANPEDPAVRVYGVHNMHLGLLYQAGLAAVVGVMLILATAARQLAALLRRADPELYRTTLALIGSFVAMNTLSLFQPTAFDRFFWMPVALTGCLWSIRRRELRAAAQGAASSTDDRRAVPVLSDRRRVGSGVLPAE